MADLSPEEAQQWFGGQTPTNTQVVDEAARIKNDPFAVWWDAITGNKSTVTGRMNSASGGGIDPIRSPNDAQAMAGALQLARDVRNAPQMDAIYRAGMAAPPRANPYNAGIADQSRMPQIALINQMRGQMNGPSIAGMQGQRAFGQSGQQALGMAAGRPGAGRAAMLGAQGAGAGLAGDVGQARLAEVMRAQAGMGGAAGNLRTGDLRSADLQAQTGLQQRKQDDFMRQFYGTQGANLNAARLDALTNRLITQGELKQGYDERDMANFQNFLNQAGSIFSMGASGVGGGGKPPGGK